MGGDPTSLSASLPPSVLLFHYPDPSSSAPLTDSPSVPPACGGSGARAKTGPRDRLPLHPSIPPSIHPSSCTSPSFYITGLLSLSLSLLLLPKPICIHLFYPNSLFRFSPNLYVAISFTQTLSSASPPNLYVSISFTQTLSFHLFHPFHSLFTSLVCRLLFSSSCAKHSMDPTLPFMENNSLVFIAFIGCRSQQCTVEVVELRFQEIRKQT